MCDSRLIRGCVSERKLIESGSRTYPPLGHDFGIHLLIDRRVWSQLEDPLSNAIELEFGSSVGTQSAFQLSGGSTFGSTLE
jgi:hypothetical protein